MRTPKMLGTVVNKAHTCREAYFKALDLLQGFFPDASRRDLEQYIEQYDTAPPRPKVLQKKAKKKGLKGQKQATKGRRAVAQGLRPPIKEAVRTVMGRKSMAISEVLEALTTKGWTPDSDDPRGYLCYVLSSNPKDFERVSRGIYKTLHLSKSTTLTSAVVQRFIRRKRKFTLGDIQNKFSVSQQAASGFVSAMSAKKLVTKTSKKGEPATWMWGRQSTSLAGV